MWYRLANGVEYSDDFLFFLKHQVRIIGSGLNINICSRLEAKTFYTMIHKPLNDYTKAEEMELYFKIHKEILAGKHGEGTLVN